MSETLTACRTPDGRVHVHYPTGLSTLCGKELPVATDLRSLPDCGVCSRAARIFDRIDGSMPEHWRPGATAKQRRTRPPLAARSAGVPGPGPGDTGWTPDRIVVAVRAWAEQTGEPPRSTDWTAGRGIGWPPSGTVIRRFRTWNLAVVAAGYVPRPNGRQPVAA